MSECRQLSESYELYALGALDDEEAVEIAEHLRRGCQECSSGIERALSSNTLLAALADQVEPPAHLRKRILASVGEEPKRRWTWTWSWTWAAAAAALLAGVFWMNNRSRQRDMELSQLRFEVRRDTADLINARQALRFLDEPETKQVVFGQGKPNPPHGRVFLNPRHGVMLLIANLPPAPNGKLYEMWLIPRGGAPQAAGMFQTDAQGSALYLREGSIDIAATGAVAVSLEPEHGSQAPTTTPLMVASMDGL